jgi:hypothetical protein
LLNKRMGIESGNALEGSVVEAPRVVADETRVDGPETVKNPARCPQTLASAR